MRNAFRNHVLNANPRLMQNHMAKGNAFSEAFALHHLGAKFGGTGNNFLRGFKEARGRQHLGQHHCRCLQRLFFFVGVVTTRAILHDKHANHRPATHDRNAEEGMINFFARFRQIFERGVVKGLREVQANGLLRNEAHKAFASLQLRLMNCLSLEAFGCIKFQHGTGAHDIDRTHLSNHVGGDHHNNFIEPLLRRLRLRHHFAELAEEDAWAECSASHAFSSGVEALLPHMFDETVKRHGFRLYPNHRRCAVPVPQARYKPHRSIR